MDNLKVSCVCFFAALLVCSAASSPPMKSDANARDPGAFETAPGDIGSFIPGNGAQPPQGDQFELVINEFLAFNDSVNQDPAGEYDDWVELYNLSGSFVELGGLYLTDDFTQLTRWTLPDTSIAPSGYILIWCDNDTGQGPMHATFAINGDGEQLGLYDRNGVTPIDTLSFSLQAVDTSFGRYPDGGAEWSPLYPTPEGPNIPLAVIAEGSQMPLPNQYALKPNFPNPFNPTTALGLELPAAGPVKLTIYNAMGRVAAMPINGWMRAGRYEVIFDGSQLASGIYLARLEVESGGGQISQTQKMVMLK